MNWSDNPAGVPLIDLRYAGGDDANPIEPSAVIRAKIAANIIRLANEHS